MWIANYATWTNIHEEQVRQDITKAQELYQLEFKNNDLVMTIPELIIKCKLYQYNFGQCDLSLYIRKYYDNFIKHIRYEFTVLIDTELGLHPHASRADPRTKFCAGDSFNTAIRRGNLLSALDILNVVVRNYYGPDAYRDISYCNVIGYCKVCDAYIREHNILNMCKNCERRSIKMGLINAQKKCNKSI